MRGSWQANNITPALIAAGLPTPDATKWMYEVTPDYGGRLFRDKLLFFSSLRLNRANLAPAGAQYLDGRQGFNNTKTDNYSGRLTWQVTPKNKITVFRDQFVRYQDHFTGRALQDWATVPFVYNTGTQYILPVKWTSTLSNRLLLEAGFQKFGYDNTL